MPAWKKPGEKTISADNDLVFVEASKPAKLKKFGASLCFANAAHRRMQHTHTHTQAAHSTHYTPSPHIRLRSGVAQWLACWAHNPKVRGLKPGSANC